jgi:hypothetical protein
MFKRVGNMPEEEVFSRTLIGTILIVSFFLGWSKWAAIILGVLFLLSAIQGVCLTCILYKKFLAKKSKS